MKRKCRVKGLVAILLCAMLVLGLAGCKPDISEYENDQILITGLLEEDFYITPGELAELDCVKATATGATEKAGTVEAYGPTLETFLAQYDKTLDEFKSIKFVGEDDYAITLGKVSWDKYDIIMSIASGNDPLEKDRRPLRLLIPGAQSGNWIYMITEIQFTYIEDSEE